jgi:hypothetical protein
MRLLATSVVIYRAAMPVTLRPLALGDVDAVHGWARLPESCRYQAWGPNTYEQTQAFVQAAVTPSANRFVFAVVLESEVVGNASLKLHGPSTAEIAFGVHPRLWGQGIATTGRSTRNLALGLRRAWPAPGLRHVRPTQPRFSGSAPEDRHAVRGQDAWHHLHSRRLARL